MILRRWLCILLCFGFLALPVRGQEQKYVALTFDDGPSGRYTRALLDGLDKRGVKATFFLCGYRMKEYPQLVGRIHESEHEIGLHGYSHSSMKGMDKQMLEREIADCFALLPTGCTPVFLRPPGGACCDGVLDAAQQAELAVLSWSVDPKDWASHDAAAVAQTVTTRVRDGDVILLHDMSESSVQAALSIVDVLKKQGFTFVTAQKMARLKGYAVEPGKIYKHFR